MRVRSLSLVLLVSLVCVACATSSPPPTGPGFLGDATVYDRLTASDRDPNIFIMRSSSRSYRDYKMVMLDPVEVVQSDGSALSLEDRAEVIEITRMFREVMEVEVGERYPIVTNPGPKTIRLRTAIVGYDPRDDTMLGLGTGAALEAEMVDALTGERIVAAVARTQGTAQPGRAARQRAYNVLTYWARLMRDRMDYERR